ncbi:unnamed protein product, partial [Polarella glacialis]
MKSAVVASLLAVACGQDLFLASERPEVVLSDGAETLGRRPKRECAPLNWIKQDFGTGHWILNYTDSSWGEYMTFLGVDRSHWPEEFAASDIHQYAFFEKTFIMNHTIPLTNFHLLFEVGTENKWEKNPYPQVTPAGLDPHAGVKLTDFRNAFEQPGVPHEDSCWALRTDMPLVQNKSGVITDSPLMLMQGKHVTETDGLPLPHRTFCATSISCTVHDNNRFNLIYTNYKDYNHVYLVQVGKVVLRLHSYNFNYKFAFFHYKFANSFLFFFYYKFVNSFFFNFYYKFDLHERQSYGGGLPLREFNKVVPPGWRPGIPGYPIKLFFERLKLWYRVTDNAEAQLGVLVAGRLQGAPQKIALRLRLPRPVAAGGGYDIGDEAIIRLSQEQLIDAATNTIVQEYIPSGLQFLCQALRAIYSLQDQDRTTVALDSFYEFKRGHLGLAGFAQEFDHRYESAEDEAGLQMNDTGKTYFFLRGSGLGDKVIEDIKLQTRGDMSRYQEIRALVLKLARANDKDKETLSMYQDQTDFNYKLNLDETNGNYYGSWHDPTTGEIIEYDYGANTSDDMYYGDYDYVYDGEYSDYDGAGYDDDWYGDDGWQDEVYHGDFPLEEWTWPASAPDSSTVSTAETTLLDVDASYWKGQTKGKGKGFGAQGKGPTGGSASGIGCAACGSRWHSSLDCPLNDPSKGGQGKGKGGKDYRYENFWKGKGKGKKGGKSKGFGKGYGSKGFGKYRPSFGFGKGKYSGGDGKSYGKGYGKGKFMGGYGGFRYSSPYNFTAFQDHEVPEAPEHAPTIAFKADGSGAQYYDFDDEKPSSSTRPAPQSSTEPMIDTDGNFGYNDGYGELDTAPAPMPDVRVSGISFLVGTCSSACPTDYEDWSSLYHSVRGVKRHGLLIDPGAASGLIGTDTLKEYREEILLPQQLDIICRPTTQNVSGISGKPEPALSRVTMPIFPGIKSSTFTADVIGKQGSKCPALLPNPSMRAANMGLLTNFYENGDGMLIVHDNGKRLLYRCLLTESGHYILPTDNIKNNNHVDEKATAKVSAFYAAVTHDAQQQWSDISAVYLAVGKVVGEETEVPEVLEAVLYETPSSLVQDVRTQDPDFSWSIHWFYQLFAKAVTWAKKLEVHCDPQTQLDAECYCALLEGDRADAAGVQVYNLGDSYEDGEETQASKAEPRAKDAKDSLSGLSYRGHDLVIPSEKIKAKLLKCLEMVSSLKDEPDSMTGSSVIEKYGELSVEFGEVLKDIHADMMSEGADGETVQWRMLEAFAREVSICMNIERNLVLLRNHLSKLDEIEEVTGPEARRICRPEE